MARCFAQVAHARGSLGLCQWNFFLATGIYILERCLLHCKLTYRTLSEESPCVESTSIISFDGMLGFRLSYIFVPCKCCCHVFWEMPPSYTVIGMYIHVFFLFRLRPYIGLAYGRYGWLALTLHRDARRLCRPRKLIPFCFLRGYNANSFPCPCVTVPEGRGKKKH